MSEIKYLDNGQEVTVIQDMGKLGILVAPHYTHYDSEYEDEVSYPTDTMIFAEKVFDKAPVEKIHAEYSAFLSKVNQAKEEAFGLKTECNVLQSKIDGMKNTVTDLSKNIINRGDIKKAKRITVFIKGRILPKEGTCTSDLKITLTYTLMNGEERAWVYSFSDTCGWLSGDYFDEEYGILCDLTDDEVEKLTVKRAGSKPVDYFPNSVIKRTEDKYLSSDLILKKKELLAGDVKCEKQSLEKTISDSVKELEVLNKKDESCQSQNSNG